ncbi:MAG: glycosyltransferase family 4 protein [Acidimicrobiia bacterium]|nr:glycosyltransferase family 4 protein [Acidimicrobiia bacterium]
MRSHRWLVLGSHIPASGRLGGMIRYTVEVLRALSERPDVDVLVHCRAETVPFLVDELGLLTTDLRPTATGSTIVDSLMERHRLGRLLDEVRPRVVLGTKQLLPSRAPGSVRVLTVHDLLPFDRPHDFGVGKRRLLPPAYRRSILDADVLACVSDATRNRLVERFPTVSDRARTIGNAMTSGLLAIDPEPIPDLEGGPPFALVVGDRSGRKNLGYVLDLWPEVVARRPDARLALVGPPGWGRNERLPGLDRLLADGVAVELGMISDARLRWAYGRAMVTLCPSRLEGFGLPVLEALNLGCPVVLSTDPAQVEAAGGRGTPVDLADRRGWIEAVVDHLDGRRPVPPAPTMRAWTDVAAELVDAADEVMARQAEPAVARGVG